MLKGSCLCGEIRFEIRDGGLGETGACHCSQCRKQSGHYWAIADVQMDDITITGAPAWYGATELAGRGFCATCGSTLFWREHGDDRISVSLGAFDDPTGVTLDMHIFVADKGDYYDIADGLPQYNAYPEKWDA
ncbi:MAG: GFA family protein [Pseudomonadota bacterium]